MIEALIVGAGPTGVVAAVTLARAGVRVMMVDRARFPRDKLCGDTINPGTLAMLRRLGLGSCVERNSLRLDGMMVTAGRRVQVRTTYPAGCSGRAISRRDLDAALVELAVAAGVRFEERVEVCGPLMADGPSGPAVRGVVFSGRGRRMLRVPAAVTIAADGRRSRLAFRLGLARHPVRPRRWAVGAYFEGVAALSACGEMHIRRGHYIGVAPLPDGHANVSLVLRPSPELADPAGVLRRVLSRDVQLRDRFAAARMLAPPVSVGPLAVDAPTAGRPGLLLAGDAAGFIDPMTGDGLRFAIRGAELAAETALRVLETASPDGHVWLTRSRAAEFTPKWRFNRMLRALVGSDHGVRAGALGAALAPPVLRQIITVAGDVHLAAAR